MLGSIDRQASIAHNRPTLLQTPSPIPNIMLGKYSHLGILGGMTISCVVVAPLAAQLAAPQTDTSKSLYVSYPPADYQTASDRIFLIGSAPSEGNVSVNNQPVPRSQKGHFASVFNLKVGKNTFAIDYKGQTKTIVVTRSTILSPIP
jgi:N-acetylmuramoyl-L-alanine amidase